MLPAGVVPFPEQMRIYWSKMDARHKVEIVNFAVAFEREELDPGCPRDCMRALEIGRAIAKANAPDCQSAVFVGEREGKIEINILTSDVRMNDYKSLGLKVGSRSRFQAVVDKVCAAYK